MSETFNPPGAASTQAQDTLLMATLQKLQARGAGNKKKEQAPAITDPMVRGLNIDTTTRVRILPGAYYQDPADGQWRQKQWWVEVNQHRLRHQAFGSKTFNCLKDVGQPCPICQYISRLWDSGSESNIALAREIGRKTRFFFNVIQREREVIDQAGNKVVVRNAGPLVLSAPGQLFEKILHNITRVGDLTRLENGWDFEIKIVDQGGWPNYTRSDIIFQQCDAGSKEEMDNWMRSLQDLNTYAQTESHEEIFQNLSGFLKVKLSTAEGPSAIDNLPRPDSGGVLTSTPMAPPQQPAPGAQMFSQPPGMFGGQQPAQPPLAQQPQLPTFTEAQAPQQSFAPPTQQSTPPWGTHPPSQPQTQTAPPTSFAPPVQQTQAPQEQPPVQQMVQPPVQQAPQPTQVEPPVGSAAGGLAELIAKAQAATQAVNPS